MQTKVILKFFKLKKTALEIIYHLIPPSFKKVTKDTIIEIINLLKPRKATDTDGISPILGNYPASKYSKQQVK